MSFMIIFLEQSQLHIKLVTSKEELESVKLKFRFKLIFFKKCISYHFIKECEQEFYMTVLLSRQKILQG